MVEEKDKEQAAEEKKEEVKEEIKTETKEETKEETKTEEKPSEESKEEVKEEAKAEDKSEEDKEEKNKTEENSSEESTEEDKDGITNIGEGQKVLLIDDEPTSVELISAILTKAGFEVMVANNGKEASAMIKPDAKPCFIVCDAVMPEMDGFTFFKQLKANEEAKEIPVILLSARKNMEDAFLAIGVEYFITKPVNVADFFEKISTLAAKEHAKSITIQKPDDK